MKIKYVLPFFLLFTMCVFGQMDRKDQDQIRAVKSSRIATSLNLTSAEAAKFWPMYLACEEKTYDINYNKIRPITIKLEEKGIDSFTPKDAQLLLMQLESAEDEIFKLKKKLMTDLRPIIGPKKVLKLRKAEDEFNRMLMNKLKAKKD
ncbi:sensor of ECF-type sigma factor [Flavobacterium cerinum]|uniref:Sensor of ECF-type sigma factor n=1 Tax=Flavobacterium cerinum TaxID=2502784 RepID=A0A3S4T1I5_9FLAO|nr:sensor of ECF-type sigma factor [Flavobacterium cerinum]RWX00451.1 sensor of ECF-type sigma factor [Flavobacterium cerinum]